MVLSLVPAEAEAAAAVVVLLSVGYPQWLL
jgi:hypothetical protein